MKPVAVVQFTANDTPAFFAHYLNRMGIPWRRISVHAGDALPQPITEYSGLVMMGGPMSVNDPLPWIPTLLEIIQDAVAQDIPVLGHCLGGQLLSRAMGGQITDNHCAEIGWHTVQAPDAQLAEEWLGGVREFTTFEWHYQTFSMPPNAKPLLGNAQCCNQAFVMGKHIGFQCHIEMTVDLVNTWCTTSAQEIEAALHQPSVQAPQAIMEAAPDQVAALNQIASSVYSRWITGLKH